MECNKYITRVIDKTIICVIEPQLNQFLGSFVLYQSIKANTHNQFNFILYVADTGICATNFFSLARECVDFEIKVLNPCKSNPYLNKLEFARDNSLENTDIVLLDWDIIFNPSKELAFPQIQEGELYARSNPTSYYSEIIESIEKRSPQVFGNLSAFKTSMSINTGVMFGKFETFNFMRERAKELMADSVIANISEKWKQEQFILSLITRELKLNMLENHWNYTPLSNKIDESDVSFWHYNDGDSRTYRLKRGLLNTRETERQLKELNRDWSSFVSEFKSLYIRSINHKCFKIFLYSN